MYFPANLPSQEHKNEIEYFKRTDPDTELKGLIVSIIVFTFGIILPLIYSHSTLVFWATCSLVGSIMIYKIGNFLIDIW